MPSLLPCCFALVIWKVGWAFAFADSFLDFDDLAMPLSTSSIPKDSIWNVDDLSSCSSDDNGQPSKLRIRGSICPSDPLAPSTTQLEAPEIPGLAEFENMLKKAPLKRAPDRENIKIVYLNGRTMATNDPNYYCARYVEESYSVPVCGSGNEWDRRLKTPPYYSQIENSKLVGPPGNDWKCLESEFYCCLIWVPYKISVQVGRGSECVNLVESGWKGYDSETANVPSSAQDDWDAEKSQQLDDDVLNTWLTSSSDSDKLQQQEFEDWLQDFYPTPYKDPLDNPLFDPEDDP